MLIVTVSQLPRTGAAVQILIPIVKDLTLISGIAVVGLLYAIGFLIHDNHGLLTKEGVRVRELVRFATLVWIFCIFGNVILEISNLLAQPIAASLDPISIKSFMVQTALGHSYFFQITIVAAILAANSGMKKVGSINIALTAALLAMIIPLFQSHASSAGNHGLAIGSLIFHVGALSLWVGGVLGLLVISPTEREESISRFSSMALWCAIIVAISGIANAWTRLNFLSGWVSLYGLLVVLKSVLMAILIGLGYKHRKFIARNLLGTRAVYQLLTGELFIMVITVVIGGWLSTTSPPISDSASRAALDPVLNLTGLPMPATPTLSRILWSYSPDGTILAILILLCALYIRGVVLLSRRGDVWPKGRTIAFIFAVAMTDFATSGGLGIYAHFAFSFHMVAHMVLGMVAPIGFVLSAPITLALRTFPIGRTRDERGVRATLLSFLNSRYSTVLTNPITALAIFDGSLFLLYLTPLFGNLMSSHSGHLIMDIHFLLSGFLFFHVIVGVDPNPRRVPHLVRIIILLAAMSIHAFFSIALMSSSTLLDGGYFASLHRPWAMNLLVDQRTGGAIGWAMGEIPILIAIIATFIQWVRDDSREAKRLDRASDRAVAMGDDDELAKYNQYLAKLADREKKFPND